MIQLFSFHAFFDFFNRTLEEAIQASAVLEFPSPRNSASMPVRFDVCGGLARFLFFDAALEDLKARMDTVARQFDVDRLTRSVEEQVKKVRVNCLASYYYSPIVIVDRLIPVLMVLVLSLSSILILKTFTAP